MSFGPGGLSASMWGKGSGGARGSGLGFGGAGGGPQMKDDGIATQKNRFAAFSMGAGMADEGGAGSSGPASGGFEARRGASRYGVLFVLLFQTTITINV